MLRQGERDRWFAVVNKLRSELCLPSQPYKSIMGSLIANPCYKTLTSSIQPPSFKMASNKKGVETGGGGKAAEWRGVECRGRGKRLKLISLTRHVEFAFCLPTTPNKLYTSANLFHSRWLQKKEREGHRERRMYIDIRVKGCGSGVGKGNLAILKKTISLLIAYPYYMTPNLNKKTGKP